MMQARYGAHELLELHESLSQMIDAINVSQMYLSHARDPELRQIVQNQLTFMMDAYNRLVHQVHGRGLAAAVPYRPQITQVTPQPMQGVMSVQPNTSVQQMDDRDVASGLLSIHKASAVMRMTAALECTDPEIRQSLLQTALNCAHQAYEIWGYMNRRGYYPLTLMEQLASTQLLRSYQPAAPSPAPFAEHGFSNGFTHPAATPPVSSVAPLVSSVTPYAAEHGIPGSLLAGGTGMGASASALSAAAMPSPGALSSQRQLGGVPAPGTHGSPAMGTGGSPAPGTFSGAGGPADAGGTDHTRLN